MKKRIATLQDALIFVLQGMYYTESKLQENFCTCSHQVTSSALEKGIESYTEISKDQKLKIERIFNYLLSDILSRTNDVVDKLMSETLQMQEATTSTHLKDVMLIGCIQNINAYKLASYRTAYRFAVELELDTVTDLLQQILEWETETGKALAALAMDEFYGMPDSYNTKVWPMLGMLTDSQIDQVLLTQFVGRIGCCFEGRVYVVPVTYAYEGGCIYVRSKEGEKVLTMRRNPDVCFQVDAVENMTNWRSVLLWGEYEELKTEQEQRQGMNILLNKLAPFMISETVGPSHQAHAPEVIEKSLRAVAYRIRIKEKSGRFEKRWFQPLIILTMLLEFEKYAMKGNEFLNRLQENLQTTDRAHAARILRSTLRVLRNHLMVEESLQLISQLPMAIKGVYVDGWRAGNHKKIKSVDDLLVEIVQEEKNDAFRDFQDRSGILNAVRAVIATLREYVSDEEMDQALATLPKKILLELEGSTW